MQPKPFLLYSRKSTEEDERQAQSLENQTSLGVSLAKQLGVPLEVVEDAHSAKEPGRPRFDEVLARIDKGEVGGLIAWHPDRLSRNEMDAAAICFRLRKGILKELHFVNYYFHNSPEGVMMLQIALSQSQYSSSKLSQDVKRGMQNKIKKGWYPHRAPLGYVNDKYKDQGEKTISKDELRFPIVRRAWEELLTGTYTVPRLLQKINDEWGLRTPPRKDGTGDRPLALNTLCRMFANVFYAGYFHHNGELFQGAHEPMVTLDEFDRAQKLIGRKNPLRPRTTQSLPFTGLIRCAYCQGQITATVKTKPSGRTYTYYHCKGRCPRRKLGVREDVLEAKIAEQLAEMEMPSEFYQWAIEEIDASNERERGELKAVYDQRLRALQGADQQLDALLGMRMRDLIDDEEYKKKHSELVLERERLHLALDKVEIGADLAREANLNAVDYMRYAREWLKQGGVHMKRLIAENFGTEYTWDGENLLLKPHPLLVKVKEEGKSLEAEYEAIELDKTLSQSQKQERISVIKAKWSGIWELNRTLAQNQRLSFVKLAPSRHQSTDSSLA